MRDPAINPKNFGIGIPNPVGPPIFRALEIPRRQENIPEPCSLITYTPLPYTGPALLSTNQWEQFRDVATVKGEIELEEKRRKEEKEELRRRAQEITLEWSHTQEAERKLFDEKLKRRKDEKEEKLTRISEEENRLKLESENRILEDTERNLRYDTQRFKELHQAMLLSLTLKEREEIAKLQEEKLNFEKKMRADEDRRYLERIEEEKKILQVKKEERRRFEKTWEEKRRQQVEEKEKQKQEEKRNSYLELQRYREVATLDEEKVRKMEELERLDREQRMEDIKVRRVEIKRLKDLEEKEDKIRLQKAQREREDQEEKRKRFDAIQAERRRRINERQEHAFKYRLAKYGGRVDITDEMNQEIVDQQDRKYINQKQVETEKYNQQEIARREAYRRRFQETQEEKEIQIQESKKQLEDSLAKAAEVKQQHQDQLHNKKKQQQQLREFWREQAEERKLMEQSQTDFSTKHLAKTFKKYAVEDDRIEEYAETLIQQKELQGLNVIPICKAKKKMTLGRSVPLVSVDGIIRLNPRIKNAYYRPEDSRERMCMNWND